MKKLFLSIGLALVAGVIHAQTTITNTVSGGDNTAGPVTANLLGSVSVSPTISGGLQEVYDAALGSTNFAVAIGGGRATTGDYNLVYLDYLYNFNNYVGLLLGFDDIARGTRFTQQDIAFVKGGINLQAPIAPLKNWGLPNLIVTPYASILMSTGNGTVGQIEVAGADFRIPFSTGWNFNFGGFYETRSSSGLPTDRTYLCVNFAVSRGF